MYILKPLLHFGKNKSKQKALTQNNRLINLFKML